jgi:hypothetical protein
MKDDTEKEASESVAQALGALEWTVVRIVFNVRARTAVGFQQYLANVGIEIPGSIIESSKWLGAFHRAPAVPKHRQGFGGLLGDRLIALGFEEGTVEKAMRELQQEVLDLCLDVQTAVANQLRDDLQGIGLHVPISMLQSGEWRDVFAREVGHLPPGAASIVRDGREKSVFRAVQEGSHQRCHDQQSLC